MQLSTLILGTVLSAATPDNVLLDFTATWCGPCQRMSPIVARLERQGYRIRKVDVDREPQLAKRFGVRNIPTFVLVANGREVTRVEGTTTEQRLLGLLAQLPKAAETADPRRDAPTQLASNTAAPSQPKKKPFPLSLFDKQQPSKPADSPADADDVVIRANDDRRETADFSNPEVDPQRSTVRLRITTPGGLHFGSGTVVDSRQGRSLIVTCGHLFRDAGRQTRVEVDVFEGAAHETYVATVVDYDLDADVGLCAIPTDAPLPVSQVAAEGTPVNVGESLECIGCSTGELPTRERVQVTGLNRYLGPDNLECTGVPVPGRSGGGLFNESGELVGLCIAADREEQRGLYCALQPIRALLTKASTNASAREDLAAKPAQDPLAELTAGNADNLAGTAGNHAFQTPSSLDAEKLAGAADAEVVCIIRPLNQPRAASRVVIINRASSKFVSYLTKEMNGQPQPTMHTVRTAEGKTASRRDSATRASRTSPTSQTRRADDGRNVFVAERYRRSAQSR